MAERMEIKLYELVALREGARRVLAEALVAGKSELAREATQTILRVNSRLRPALVRQRTLLRHIERAPSRPEGGASNATE
jgi:hypothetical protein